MYRVTYIVRNPSNGSEDFYCWTFDSLEKASEYIRTKWYDSFCDINDYPSAWYDEHMGMAMPSRESFSVDELKKVRFSTVFAPLDSHFQIVPNELRLDKVHAS